jgi:hypothetical protein
VPALARLRLFPGRSPSTDGVWRAKKGEVLSKIFALPWPPPCCLPPVTSACCQCLRWSAWGPCAAFSHSALLELWVVAFQSSTSGEAAQVVGHGEHPQCGWWVKEQHNWWGQYTREKYEWWSSMEESTLCNSETKSQIHTHTYSKGGYSMSWGAQNRPKDAKTPNVGPAMSESPIFLSTF